MAIKQLAIINQAEGGEVTIMFKDTIKHSNTDSLSLLLILTSNILNPLQCLLLIVLRLQGCLILRH